MVTRFAAAAATVLMLLHATVGSAQSNGLQPAEPPPASFEGSRYVDSDGCVFLRSRFGGEVSWIPLFGADLRPVCNGDPKDALAVDTALASAADAAESAPTDAAPADAAPDEGAPNEGAPNEGAPDEGAAAAAPAPAPRSPDDPARTRASAAPTVVATTKEAAAHTPRQQTPRRTAPAASVQRGTRPSAARHVAGASGTADPSGRHPACPVSAPYGEMVTIADGRRMVRCVARPDLMLAAGAHDPVVIGVPSHRSNAPSARVSGAPAGTGAHASFGPMPLGGYVQVGAYSVASNAQRARRALVAKGLPVKIRTARSAGRTLEIVMVGPVEPGDGLRETLAIVRAMGYRDAFVRR